MGVQPLNAAPEACAVNQPSDLRNTLSLDSLNFFLSPMVTMFWRRNGHALSPRGNHQ